MDNITDQVKKWEQLKMRNSSTLEENKQEIPRMSLTINVKDSDDEEFLKRTLKATDLCSFIWDFQQYLRSIWDGNRELTEDQHKLIDEIWERWHNELDDNGIKLEEIYS